MDPAPLSDADLQALRYCRVDDGRGGLMTLTDAAWGHVWDLCGTLRAEGDEKSTTVPPPWSPRWADSAAGPAWAQFYAAKLAENAARFRAAYQQEPAKPQPIPEGVAITVVAGNRVLLAKRIDASKSYYGYFAPPGGKVEAGEGHREAAIRELAEETGITTWRHLRYVNTYVKEKPDGSLYRLHCWAASVSTDTGAMNREPTKLGPWGWYTEREALALRLIHPDDTSIVDALRWNARAFPVASGVRS